MNRKKILVVDDDASFRRFAREGLESTGKFIVFLAEVTNDAVKMAKAFMPNVILLSEKTSNISGSEVAGQLKSDLRTENIPIIFLTAEGNGFHPPNPSYRYLTKPLNLAELMRCIEEKAAG